MSFKYAAGKNTLKIKFESFVIHYIFLFIWTNMDGLNISFFLAITTRIIDLPPTELETHNLEPRFMWQRPTYL